VPLKWTPVDTVYESNTTEGNRWARSIPLYFDGTELHALVPYNETDCDSTMVKVVLESYTIDDNNKICLQREVTLTPPEAEIAEGNKYWADSSAILKHASIACNGEYLILSCKDYTWVFNSNTGAKMSIY